jgi:hypothetical protein
MAIFFGREGNMLSGSATHGDTRDPRTTGARARRAAGALRALVHDINSCRRRRTGALNAFNGFAQRPHT